jgi:hypothetical protein
MTMVNIVLGFTFTLFHKLFQIYLFEEFVKAYMQLKIFNKLNLCITIKL